MMMLSLRAQSFILGLLHPKAIIGLAAMMFLAFAAFATVQNASAVTENASGIQLECLAKTGNAGIGSVALDGLLSTRAVACTYEMVNYARKIIVPVIAGFMEPIGLAVILLAFVLFGLRLTLQGGVQNPYGDTFIMIFKAAVVMYILSGMAHGTQGNLADVAMGVQNELIEWTEAGFTAVMNPENSGLLRECRNMQDITPPNHSPETTLERSYAIKANVFSAGSKNVIIDGQAIPGAKVWITVDCLAGLVIGVAAGVIRDVAIFSMILAMLSSGPLGIACFICTIIFMLTLLVLVARSVFLLMQAYLVIAVILMFLPLVIPTIMFRKTYDYFARYLSLYTGIIFQPVIMIIFLSFAAQGIGVFLVGNKSDFKNLLGVDQQKSSMTKNVNEIYSMWQILLFERTFVTAEERIKMMRSLVNSDPGLEIISMQGMAALNLYGKYGDTLDKLGNLTANPFYLKKVTQINPITNEEETVISDLDMLEKAKTWSGELGDLLKQTDYQDVMDLYGVMRSKTSGSGKDANADNKPGTAGIYPFYLPFFDLKPDGKYDQYLQKLKREDDKGVATKTPVLDGDGNQLLDDDDNPVFEYKGIHAWYAEPVIDANFETWFMRKLFTAIFGLLLTTYIFFSLNDSVPDIARTITGSASYVMASEGGAFGGIPGGRAVESFLRQTDNSWTAKFKEMAGDSSSPQERFQNFLSSGKDAIMSHTKDARREHMSPFLHSLEERVTGKKDDNS